MCRANSSKDSAVDFFLRRPGKLNGVIIAECPAFEGLRYETECRIGKKIEEATLASIILEKDAIESVLKFFRKVAQYAYNRKKLNNKMLKNLIALQVIFATAALCNPNSIIVPCKKGDDVCMAKSANIAVPIIAAGIPALDVESFDPVILKEVSEEVSNLFFNATNTKVTGYKSCEIRNVRLNLDAWKLSFDAHCPKFTLEGHLVLAGELLNVPVEGNDDYKIVTGKFLIKVNADIERRIGSDGQTHLAITSFNEVGTPLEPVTFDYKNFKVKKDLTPEKAAAFKKHYFQKFSDLASPVFIKRQYQIMFASVNKFLESIPFDNLFLN
ncbi:uncharacterized protein [Battus philenor]|uniref:uncharacterized protein n=1 Tax=Battus philenor TaxID=42288 RepID=UPI0035D0726D